MLDGFGRNIDYLRISVTDRCNYRCAYCMPPEGVVPRQHGELLTYEEIARLTDVASRACGIRRVRITGGEPLVRTGLVDLIAQLRALPALNDIAMTTNGSLLAGQAAALKAAGLDRVNISLDTFDAHRYRELTGGGALAPVLAAIEAAVALAFEPVKINVVLTAALSRSDVMQLQALVMRLPVIVRFIEYMPIGRQGIAPGLSVAQVKALLEAAGGALLPDAPILGAGPARNYRLAGAAGAIGFITPMSDRFCPACNRLRLTADGRLKPCLLSDAEINVREYLRAGADDDTLAALLQAAVRAKPQGHRLTAAYDRGFERQMCQIGG